MNTLHPAHKPDSRFHRRLARIMEGPEYPDRWFIHEKQRFARIYAAAAAIRRFLKDATMPGAAVCLCAEDKGVVAATLLATMDGRTPLVIPHSNAPRPLEELYHLTRFKAAITDTDRQLPPDTAVFRPVPGDKENGAGWVPVKVDPHREWLRLYTGGSTGSPRVWPKSLANLFLEAFYLCDRFTIDRTDRIVATVATNHIYGLLYTVLIPLAASASVIADIPTFPQEIVSAVDRQSATILASVPAHYRILNGQPPFGASLRIAFSSAGALAPEDGDAFFRQTRTPVTEIYGSTETGGIAGRCRSAGESGFAPFAPIDWQFDEDRLRIRSAFLSPCLPTDDQGFFTTPDRIQARGDRFVLKGRSDNVVKVGGNRVDVERTRESLTGLDGVRDAFVMAAPSAGGRENELVAVVESEMDEGQIRRELAAILESHEMPRRIRTVRRMATTAAGKYDRKQMARLFD